MKKSKEFIVQRGYFKDDKRHYELNDFMVYLNFLNGVYARSFCYRLFRKFFGITLAPGERKQVKITIEEV